MKNERIAWGTMGVKDNEMKAALHAAYLAKYDYIDTAWIYKVEPAVGRALEELGLQDKFRVQTKLWSTHFLTAREAFTKQLADLRLKKVWCLLLHRPTINFDDAVVAWQDLIQFKKEGLVEHIGVSNFDRDHLHYLKNKTGVLPEYNQIELSVDNFREDRVVVNRQLGIKIQSWSPLGTRALSNPVVLELAKKYQTSAASILVAYLANQDLCPIVKSGNPVHVAENAKALAIHLLPAEIARLKKENTYSPKFPENFPVNY